VVLRKAVEPLSQHLLARMQEYEYCEEKIIPDAHFCKLCSITVFLNYLYNYTVIYIIFKFNAVHPGGSNYLPVFY